MQAKQSPDRHDSDVILHLNECLFSTCTNLQVIITNMAVNNAAVNGERNLENINLKLP